MVAPAEAGSSLFFYKSKRGSRLRGNDGIAGFRFSRRAWYPSAMREHHWSGLSAHWRLLIALGVAVAAGIALRPLALSLRYALAWDTGVVVFATTQP